MHKHQRQVKRKLERFYEREQCAVWVTVPDVILRAAPEMAHKILEREQFYFMRRHHKKLVINPVTEQYRGEEFNRWIIRKEFTSNKYGNM